MHHIVKDIILNKIFQLNDVLCIGAESESFFHTFAIEELEKLESPEVLITYGNGFTSKVLKNYFRSLKGIIHYHISMNGDEVDTFLLGSKAIKCTKIELFQFLSNVEEKESSNYKTVLERVLQKVNISFDFFKNEYWETILISRILQGGKIDMLESIHLGNSTIIRHVNEFPVFKNGLKFYGNRGTSGIDGTISTAIGQAIVSPKTNHLCILGDLSFQYDSGALFNIPLCQNLGIIIINNGGGKIFSLLEGSKNAPEIKDYFMASHHNNFQYIAMQHSLTYILIKNIQEFDSFLELRNQDEGFCNGKIIEIFIEEGSPNLTQVKERVRKQMLTLN